MGNPFRFGLNEEPLSHWWPGLTLETRKHVLKYANNTFERRNKATFEFRKARCDQCPFPTDLSKWTENLNDSEWPYLRFVRVLVSSAKGLKYQTWLFSNAEAKFKQEIFWTLKTDKTRQHSGKTKGRAIVSFIDVTHGVIWC
jgi:hypothetical protein